MKLKDIIESSVSYKTLPTRRFRVSAKVSFEELKDHKDIISKSGPHTFIFDVSNEERVKNSPGENKWNAMKMMYGEDEDEIACAFTGYEWICLAINVKI